jgi:hypothetical protein
MESVEGLIISAADIGSELAVVDWFSIDGGRLEVDEPHGELECPKTSKFGGEEGRLVIEGCLAGVTVPDEAVEDREASEVFADRGMRGSEIPGSTSLIVDVLALPCCSGRAGNLDEILSSSLIARSLRAGVDGEQVVCEKRDDRDGEIDSLKFATVLSSDEAVVP